MKILTKPYTYQCKGVHRIVNRFDGRALLADEVGLGKSLQALAVAAIGEWWPMLIICPASLKNNWRRECKIHLGIDAEILETTKVPAYKRPRSKITIINYDILHAWLPYLEDCGFVIIVIDEIHYIKNPKARRTKVVRTVCKEQEHILGLSGTPIVNRPIELFPMINMLWPDEFPSMFSFGMEFCKPERTPWGWKFNGAQNLPELHAKLKSLGMVRRRKEDVLHDLPAKQRFVVPLPIKDRKEYDKAESDFINWLKSKSPAKAERARHAKRLVQMGYLIRLACKLKFQAVEHWIDNLLQESDGKFILLGRHIPPTLRLAAKYKGLCVCIHGGIEVKNRQKLVDQFNESKRTRLLIGNSPAWTGYNMQAASGLAFYEQAWTPGEHDQGEGRPHRIGQKKKVSVWYLVAEGTIEEDRCKLLQEKQKITSSVLDGHSVEGELDIYDRLEAALLRRRRS